MSDAREQRTPAEEAAERARAQTEERVDTWLWENHQRVEQAWERSAEGQKSWKETAQQTWPGAIVYDADLNVYQHVRRVWHAEVRDPAVEHALAQEAVEKGIVTQDVADQFLHPSNMSEGAPIFGLHTHAGGEAYHHTVERWRAQHQEITSPEPARENERAVAADARREPQLEQEEQQAIQAARQQQEQAAARAAMQAEQRVDTWVKAHAPRIQQAWEHSTEGKKSWVTSFQHSPDDDHLVRQNWQKEARNPAVEQAVAQEAVREGIVSPGVAERYLSPANIVFDQHDIGRREVPLRAFAADIAYEQTLEQWKTPSREVPSPEPAGRQDRDLARTATRDQHARSQDMAARGWGQSWDAQRHAQERGLNQ